MDADRFDALTRLLGERRPRRAALGLLGAGVAGFATFAAGGEAGARHKRKHQKHCLQQGADCQSDSQCCTGICDKYTNRCQQVRVSCANGESCPHGQCCPQFGQQCLYKKATQKACEPKESCGYILCGTSCDQLNNPPTYQFCGFEGSAACRDGKCCCPNGVALADCPNLQGSGNLPRCP